MVLAGVDSLTIFLGRMTAIFSDLEDLLAKPLK
jgi:hypothetical protein